jgi:hypothetical protein
MTVTQAATSLLESFSPEEYALTVTPLLSFFTTSFSQCTKFAKQLTILNHYGTVSFGESLLIPLNKNDMIGRVYIIYTTPGIRHHSEACHKFEGSSHHKFSDYSDCSSSSDDRHKKKHGHSSSSSSEDEEKFNPKKHYVTWADSFAHVATEYIELQFANVQVNKHSGEYLEIMDGFSNKPGCSTDETVGRYKKEADLWRASRKVQKRIVRARFHFCESIGKALPIFAIRKTSVRIVLKLRPFEECWFSSDNSVPMLIDVDAELRPTDIKVEVAANVYHLTKAERAQIYGEDHLHLMHQVQEICVPLKNEDRSANLPIAVKLNAKHPVVSMWYTIQRDQHLKEKDWYNYSGENNEDPLEKVKITINDKDLFPLWFGKWFRTIEPMEGFTNIPNKHIYTHSFAICPEDESFHSGYLNFTAIDDVTIHLMLQRGLGPVWFKAWLKTINLFRVKDREVGLGWF